LTLPVSYPSDITRVDNDFDRAADEIAAFFTDIGISPARASARGAGFR
jgi:hypothetical protein